MARYAGAGLFASLVSLIIGVYAYASQVTVTYSGTITTANDISGYFGATTTAMNGKAFTLAFTMDDSKGTQYLGTWPTCNNGLQNSGTSNPVPYPVLTITSGTRPYTFGALASNSLTSFTYSSNATSPKTKLYNKLGPVFSGFGKRHDGDRSQQHEHVPELGKLLGVHPNDRRHQLRHYIIRLLQQRPGREYQRF
jgi:hypothetical protein